MPVTTRHPRIAEMLPEWDKINDVLEGPRRVKQRRTTYINSSNTVVSSCPYLPRCPGQSTWIAPTGESVDEYANYLYRAVLLPFAGPLVHKMCGLVMKKPPAIDVPFDADLRNITLDGTTAEGLAWQMLRTTISTSFGVLLTSWSDAAQRPFHRWYPDQSVVDFTPAAQYGVSQLRVFEHVEEATADEFVPDVVEQYRVVELITDVGLLADVRARDLVISNPANYPLGFLRHRLFRKERDKDGRRTGDFIELPLSEQPPIPTRAGAPIPFVPATPLNPFGATWEIPTPMLSYLTELLLAAFRNSADYEQLLHECGAGTVLHGSGFTKAEQSTLGRVGGGSVVMTEGPSTLDYTQTNGQSGKEIFDAIEQKKTDMGIAVGRLLLSQQKNVAESGAALGLQFAGDDATLQIAAGATAMALERAFAIHAWWQGTQKTPADVANVHVELNDQFVVTPLQAQEIVSLATGRDMNAYTDRDLYYQLKRGQALDPETTFEKWQAERGNAGMDSSLMAEVQTSVAAMKAAMASGDQEAMTNAMASLDAMMSTAAPGAE